MVEPCYAAKPDKLMNFCIMLFNRRSLSERYSQSFTTDAHESLIVMSLRQTYQTLRVIICDKYIRSCGETLEMFAGDQQYRMIRPEMKMLSVIYVFDVYAL